MPSALSHTKRRLTHLARELCANYFLQANGIRDYCLLEPDCGMRCVFAAGENEHCDYFECAVLPTDPDLQAIYRAAQDARDNGPTSAPKDVKRTSATAKRQATCGKCGKEFFPRSNRQQYCSRCRTVIARETQRAYRQRQKGSRVIVRDS
jgi:hypothetical protein